MADDRNGFEVAAEERLDGQYTNRSAGFEASSTIYGVIILHRFDAEYVGIERYEVSHDSDDDDRDRAYVLDAGDHFGNRIKYPGVIYRSQTSPVLSTTLSSISSDFQTSKNVYLYSES
ncbi:hypothetical protein U1Q18_048532 [Sarracenia purpurea var. burkii]